MNTKTAKIKAVEPAIPPTYQSAYGVMNAYQVTFADGNKYKFSAKGDFKKQVGEEIEYQVTNEEYKNAKLVSTYKPMSKSNRDDKTFYSILSQVCYKSNKDVFGAEYDDQVQKKTRADVKWMIELINDAENGSL